MLEMNSRFSQSACTAIPTFTGFDIPPALAMSPFLFFLLPFVCFIACLLPYLTSANLPKPHSHDLKNPNRLSALRSVFARNLSTYKWFEFVQNLKFYRSEGMKLKREISD
jgi:hypothetical protein